MEDEIEYVEVSDDSGHRYVIPLERQVDWDAWIEDTEEYDAPEWAEYIDGGQVIFKEYRIW